MKIVTIVYFTTLMVVVCWTKGLSAEPSVSVELKAVDAKASDNLTYLKLEVHNATGSNINVFFNPSYPIGLSLQSISNLLQPIKEVVPDTVEEGPNKVKPGESYSAPINIGSYFTLSGKGEAVVLYKIRLFYRTDTDPIGTQHPIDGSGSVKILMK